MIGQSSAVQNHIRLDHSHSTSRVVLCEQIRGHLLIAPRRRVGVANQTDNIGTWAEDSHSIGAQEPIRSGDKPTHGTIVP